MKSLFKVSLLAATVMLAVGCQKEEEPKVEPAAQEQVQAETGKAVHFKTEDDKAAYAIGVSFANYLSTSIEKPAEFGIELKKELVLKGIEQAFAGNAELSEDEIRAALEGLDKRVAETMQKQAEEKAAAAMKRVMISALSLRNKKA
ncbi:FKBP-type peptidyl-prolyl cis-trans isomerase FkpA precursor [Vibrio maritimus]|uniref:FKBP-type peptidyl-prolyl cis-trans isomerase FkpA n=1 Tax=Vibrio maritimus TaxID=990268 RepID=A0A090S9P6_9VIBR|nr:FKBP-type peptidyl-prolyl cis-trans isomerase FkpA precursor [Vibrio maritimus]